MKALFGWDPDDEDGLHPIAYELSKFSVMQAATNNAGQIKKCPDCHPDIHLIPCWEEQDNGDIVVTWAPLEAHDRGCPNFGGLTSTE